MDLVWDEKLTGAGSFTHDTGGSFGVLQISDDTGDEVIRQSPYQRYQPGKSQFVAVTFDMVATEDNVVKQVGYFDDDNGIFLQLSGTSVSIVKRSKATGSVVNTEVAQASWDDPFDGTGPSGITLDITKSQIFWMDLEYLRFGDIQRYTRRPSHLKWQISERSTKRHRECQRISFQAIWPATSVVAFIEVTMIEIALGLEPSISRFKGYLADIEADADSEKTLPPKPPATTCI